MHLPFKTAQIHFPPKKIPVLLKFVLQLSKSDDLRVLIARKKGERSAPPTYLSGRRYSYSGSEGDEDEVDRGRGRRGGLSSVVKVPERWVLCVLLHNLLL